MISWNWKKIEPWTDRPTDDSGSKTEPLSDPKPFTEIISKASWVTNGYFTVYKTDLGTLHVFTFGSFDYCASDVVDLQAYIHGLYNERLQRDFSTYINLEKFYTVEEPVWLEAEAI